METLSVRYEDDFLHDMEKVMKKHRYATKAEFIREAVRDKIKELENREALLRLERISGSSTRHTTKEQMRKAKKEAFEEVAKRHTV